MKLLDSILETNLVPDPLVRTGIRRLLKQNLRARRGSGPAHSRAALQAHVAELRRSPIAIQTRAANEQHYEVPTRFYQLVLGPRLKYSSGLWNTPADTLAQSEENMLDLTCQRAGIADGQDILELGCGWGLGVAAEGSEKGGKDESGQTAGDQHNPLIIAEADR